jgi:hypothetical protein
VLAPVVLLSDSGDELLLELVGDPPEVASSDVALLLVDSFDDSSELVCDPVVPLTSTGSCGA